MAEQYMPLSKASRETGIAEAELRALCEGDSLDWHGIGRRIEGYAMEQVDYYVKSADVARYIAGRPHSTVGVAQK